MTRWVVLLRAVNVGGRNLVPMARWRDLLAAAGFADVATHLQSGNAVVSPGTVADDPAAVTTAVRGGLADGLGLDVSVLVRSGGEVARVAAAAPWPEADPATVGVMFCDREVPSADLDRLAAKAGPREEVVAAGWEVYLLYGDGMGRSRLGTARTEAVGTVRNLRTVRRLAELAGAAP